MNEINRRNDKKYKKVLDAQQIDITFADLIRSVGEDAYGDFGITLDLVPNVFIWYGISKEFIAALETVKPELETYAVSPFIYIFDGLVLNMPIAKKFPRNGYKEPHWQPVIFSKKKA